MLLLTPPPYDLNHIRQLVRNDEAVVRRLAQIFMQTVPSMLQSLGDALACHDWLALSEAAHHLKSTLDSMGVRELQQPIRDLERCLLVPLAPEHASRATALVQEVTGQALACLQAEFPEL